MYPLGSFHIGLALALFADDGRQVLRQQLEGELAVLLLPGESLPVVERVRLLLVVRDDRLKVGEGQLCSHQTGLGTVHPYGTWQCGQGESGLHPEGDQVGHRRHRSGQMHGSAGDHCGAPTRYLGGLEVWPPIARVVPLTHFLLYSSRRARM
ncbi:hypothetical protein D9M69_590010 [compost metagenome]